MTTGNSVQIYFIGNSDRGFVKIGVSRQPAARLAQLQKYNPFKLELFASLTASDISEAYKIERQLHEWLQSDQSYGEWFMLTDWVKSVVLVALRTSDVAKVMAAARYVKGGQRQRYQAFCSFCGNPSTLTRDGLVAGGLGAMICASCIEDCRTIISRQSAA